MVTILLSSALQRNQLCTNSIYLEFDEAEDEVEEEDEAEGSLEQSRLVQLQTLAGEEVNEVWIQYQESLAAMQVCTNCSIFFGSFVLVYISVVY